MEEEIDLREYIAVIIRHWYWIVGLSLIGGLLALGISILLPSVYEAEARIIILKATTNISFEPRIQSDSSPEQSNFRNNQETLVNLVTSSSVAEQVLAQLPPAALTEGLTTAQLLAMVDASNTANLINITISNTDPEVAALIANTWAETYVTFINRLYSDGGGTLLAEVEGQVVEAENAYKMAQKELEQALSNSQIAILQRDIALLRQDLNAKYATVEQQLNNRNELLVRKYAELRTIDAWLEDIKLVSEQLTIGSASSSGAMGDALALMLLRQRSVGDNSNIQLNIDLANVNDSFSTAADAEIVAGLIESHQTRVLDDIAALSNELLLAPDELLVSKTAGENPFVASVTPVMAQIATLESSLEARLAQNRELVAARDLAWENLQAIQLKSAEVLLDTQITDSEVKLAARAIVPEHSISPRPLVNILIGFILGFTLGIAAVFVIEYWPELKQLSEWRSSSSEPSVRPSESA